MVLLRGLHRVHSAEPGVAKLFSTNLTTDDHATSYRLSVGLRSAGFVGKGASGTHYTTFQSIIKCHVHVSITTFQSIKCDGCTPIITILFRAAPGRRLFPPPPRY